MFNTKSFISSKSSYSSIDSNSYDYRDFNNNLENNFPNQSQSEGDYSVPIDYDYGNILWMDESGNLNPKPGKHD